MMDDEPGALEKALERAEKAEADVEALQAANVRLQEALAADPLDQSMANEKLLEQVAEARAEVAALRAALNTIAEHLSSDWPERCRNNVRVARAALAVKERP